MVNWDDGPQKADALEKVNKTLGNTTNKLLYILVIEDPSSKTQTRSFATSKVDKLATYVELIGYEITNAQGKKIKTWDDAVELATQEKMEIVNISFPWQRIISITNVSYKVKSV